MKKRVPKNFRFYSKQRRIKSSIRKKSYKHCNSKLTGTGKLIPVWVRVGLRGTGKVVIGLFLFFSIGTVSSDDSFL